MNNLINHRILVIACLLTCSLNIAACQEPTDSKATESAGSPAELGDATASQKIEEQLRQDIIKVELELAEATKQLAGTHPRMVALKGRLDLLSEKLAEIDGAIQHWNQPRVLPPLRIVGVSGARGDIADPEVGFVISRTGFPDQILASKGYPEILRKNDSLGDLKIDGQIATRIWGLGTEERESVVYSGFAWLTADDHSVDGTDNARVQFSLKVPIENQILYAPIIGSEKNLLWKKLIVKETWEFNNSTVIETSNVSVNNKPRLLFDEDGKLVAIRCVRRARPGTFTVVDGKMYASERTRWSDGFTSVADLAEQLQAHGISISADVMAECKRRKRPRFDSHRPIELKSMFLNWSDDHDELYGFSRKSGKTSTLKIEPKDFFDWLASDEGVIVDLGDSVAGYSSVTESWDVIRIDASQTASKSIDSTLNKLSIKGLPHHYEFSTQAGKWISPTDSELLSKRQPAEMQLTLTKEKSGEVAVAYRAEAGQESSNAASQREPATTVAEYLRLEIVKAELALDELKSQFGATHPKVVEQEERLTRLNGKLVEVHDVQRSFPDESLNRAIPTGMQVVTLRATRSELPQPWLTQGDRIDIILRRKAQHKGKLQTQYFPLLNDVDVFSIAVKESTSNPLPPGATIEISLLVGEEDAKTLSSALQRETLQISYRQVFWGTISPENQRSATESGSTTERLIAALDTTVSLHYDNVPLKDIVSEIATTRKINIALDTREFEAQGFDANPLISINVQDIPLRSALTRILQQAGRIGLGVENDVLKLSPAFFEIRDLDRASLDRWQSELLASLNTLEGDTIELAKSYRTAAAAVSSEDRKEVEAAEQQLAVQKMKLKRSFTLAFEARRKLHEVKLQLAELDLAEVRAKHVRRASLADQIIERRVEDLMNGEDLEWSTVARPERSQKLADGSADATAKSSGMLPSSSSASERNDDLTDRPGANPVPTFATPQELVDYVTRLNAEASEDEVATMDQMFDLVTDDEINRFAGLMLRTTSMMQMAAGLGAAFGSSDGSDGNDQRQQMAAFLQAVGRMNLIVDKYRHKNPAPEALAAYQEIAGGLNLSMLFQGAAPTTTVTTDEYSQKLRLAAGVLNNPKAFLSEIMKEMQTIEATQSAADGKASGSKVKPDWQLTVNGESAFAIDQSAKPEASNTLNLTGTTQRMDLIKVGDTWKISSLIPDNVIIEMQQGPTVKESSSPASAQPSMQPLYQPASSAPTYAPVETYSGVNSATAAQALQPFTELNSSNVCNNHVFVDSEIQKAIDVSSVHGRYINRPLERGKMITADMLMDKPSTEQIVQFWLDEAATGENIFAQQELPATRTGRSDLAVSRPYQSESVEYLRPQIPDWTQEYLNELNRQLAELPPDEWTANTVNQMMSIQPLVQSNTSDSSLKFCELGKHLHEFLIAASDTQDANLDGDVIAAAQSSALLGLAFRLNGSLPEEILDAVPASATVQKKLQLLTTMIENKADDRWVAQERRRLFGLLEEAPVQALKILMSLGQIESAEVLENWLFSMSSEAVYNERHRQGGNPGTPFSPIVDPVLVIGVADLINQGRPQSSETLAWFFFEDDGDERARVFIVLWDPNDLIYNQISDIIEGNLAYREFVLTSLANVYSKADSQLLKDNIANLAPAVPVMSSKP